MDQPQPLPSTPSSASEPAAPLVPFAIIVPTVYGNMIVNRYDINQTNALIKTGMAHGHREILILSRLLNLLGKDQTFIDVGANIGTHSLAMSHCVGPRGHVHAFEAQRIIFNMLAGTMALNGLTNVHCYNMAVGDREGRIEIPQFDYNRKMNFGSVEFGGQQREKLAQDPGHDPSRVEYVPLTTLDRFEFQSVNLMKIDVEGMEVSVVDGAAKTIARCRPVVFIEFVKSDKAALARRIAVMDYEIQEMGESFLCLPKEAVGELLQKAGVPPSALT
ncbi:MAG: FkbM family methyltransferase [Tepidisphaeraceae bacterium]